MLCVFNNAVSNETLDPFDERSGPLHSGACGQPSGLDWRDGNVLSFRQDDNVSLAKGASG